MEIGSLAIFSTREILSSGISIRSASSSGVGSRPASLTLSGEMRLRLVDGLNLLCAEWMVRA